MSTITIYDFKYTAGSSKGKIYARQATHLPEQGWYKWVHENGWIPEIRRDGRDCALTRENALKLADELRQRKIRNLQRQIERLQALEFTIVEEGA